MNRYRLGALALVPAAALTMAACSSSTTSGKGTPAAGSSTSSSGSSSSSSSAPTSSAASTSTSAATPAAVKELASKLQQGLANTRTAHITLDIDLAGQTIKGAGDEKLSGGKLQAIQITEGLPGNAGSLELIVVDNKIYAKLPKSVAKTSKPYVLVTSSSSNSLVKQLASSIQPALNSASIGQVSDFVTAAKSATLVGKTTIGGVSTEHYSVVVDTTKLPANFPDRDALAQAGITSLPVELYIDSQGRPVQIDEKVAVQGQTVQTTITVSKYNQPVTISAPPASQVGTS